MLIQQVKTFFLPTLTKYNERVKPGSNRAGDTGVKRSVPMHHFLSLFLKIGSVEQLYFPLVGFPLVGLVDLANLLNGLLIDETT